MENTVKCDCKAACKSVLHTLFLGETPLKTENETAFFFQFTLSLFLVAIWYLYICFACGVQAVPPFLLAIIGVATYNFVGQFSDRKRAALYGLALTGMLFVFALAIMMLAAVVL